MNLEDAMLSETSQSQKDKYCVIPLTRGTEKSQVHSDGQWSGGCQRLGRGRGTLLLYGDRAGKRQCSVGGDGRTTV